MLQRAILLLDDRYAQHGNAVETHVRPELQLCLNKTFPDGCDPEILRKQKENVSAKSTDEELTISADVATVHDSQAFLRNLFDLIFDRTKDLAVARPEGLEPPTYSSGGCSSTFALQRIKRL